MQLETPKCVHTYKAYGINISSCLPLPDVLPGKSEPDVRIRYGPAPDALENVRSRGVCFQAAPGQLLLILDKVAKYFVREGREVVIQRTPEATDDDVRSILLASVMGAVLNQRGLLVLHASAIEHEGRAILFLGATGNGKSTLAAAFVQRGYRLLTDDVCAVSIGNSRPPILLPGYPNVKVWRDSLDRLDPDHDSLPQVRPELEKFRVATGDCFCEDPLPLGRAYVLDLHNKDHFEADTLKGRDKMMALMANTYRLQFVLGMGRGASHFQQCSIVADHIPVVRVTRPSHGFRVHETVDLVEKDLAR